MTDLTRYGFDRSTGVYVGPTWAHISPREPGVVLEPAFSTHLRPPEAVPGTAAVWAGSAWTLRPDYRGQTWFRGRAPVRIFDFVDPATLGLTREPTAAE